MSTYVRFILMVLIGGALVSLAIVVYSNERGRRKQQITLAAERAALSDAVGKMSGHLRRGQVAVNGQKIDANGKILETSLLVRQLTYKLEPLPVSEIIIPGSTVCIDGMRLEFGDRFREEFKEMRGSSLAILMHVAGKDQKTAPFSFWPGWQQGNFIVPEALQIYAVGKEARVTYFETRLWRYVWELLDSPQARANAGIRVVTPREEPGLKTCAEVFLKDFRHTGFYEVAIGLEGVTITESANPAVRMAMIEEWRKQNAKK